MKGQNSRRCRNLLTKSGKRSLTDGSARRSFRSCAYSSSVGCPPVENETRISCSRSAFSKRAFFMLAPYQLHLQTPSLYGNSHGRALKTGRAYPGPQRYQGADSEWDLPSPISRTFRMTLFAYEP